MLHSRATSIPICISERLATRFRFREMFEQHAVGVVMYDVTWCGGRSEAKKISDMAGTYKIPTAPPTGRGPHLWFSPLPYRAPGARSSYGSGYGRAVRL